MCVIGRVTCRRGGFDTHWKSSPCTKDGDRDDDADHAGRKERMCTRDRRSRSPALRPGRPVRSASAAQVRKSLESSTSGCRTPEKVTTVIWGCVAAAAAGLRRKAPPHGTGVNVFPRPRTAEA